MATETEEEDPMAALLAADENDDDEATANHEESDYDPLAALDDFEDQKEARYTDLSSNQPQIIPRLHHNSQQRPKAWVHTLHSPTF